LPACFRGKDEVTNWDECQSVLGTSFHNSSLLEQAFIHSSYLNEDPHFTSPSNERLEFLGDAVLDFVVADLLYKEFPTLSEGELTMVRASLVCSRTLTEIASLLGLGRWLLLGRGEEASEGRTRQSTLADTAEALIGAIYLDQGLTEATDFVIRQLGPYLGRIRQGYATPNYKALLQELVQSEGQPPPTYRVAEAAGPAHQRQFTVEVLIQGEVMGQGMGRSKKAAEMDAAAAAWKRKTQETRLSRPDVQ
jgi:ribonuclease-3